MNKEQFDNILHDAYVSAQEIFGSNLSELILYGSFARGDYEDGSDIDIMILVNEDRRNLNVYRAKVTEMSWKLGMDYDILVSMTLDSMRFFHDWKDDLPFYRNVWNEGIKISA
jgi:predicted nucleotidyltransferase